MPVAARAGDEHARVLGAAKPSISVSMRLQELEHLLGLLGVVALVVLQRISSVAGVDDHGLDRGRADVHADRETFVVHGYPRRDRHQATRARQLRSAPCASAFMQLRDVQRRSSPPSRPRPWCAARWYIGRFESRDAASTQARHCSSVRPVFVQRSANSFLALLLGLAERHLHAAVGVDLAFAGGLDRQVDHVLVMRRPRPTARRRTAWTACSRTASATAPCGPGLCWSSRCSWRLPGGLRRRPRASCRTDGRGAAARTGRPGGARCRPARPRSCGIRA